jgi:tetratricopeptide (TPR) repeat protein
MEFKRIGARNDAKAPGNSAFGAADGSARRAYSNMIPTRKDVEAKLATLGDYVKIDYLTRCLKQSLDFDTRKFVLTELAKIYEERAMPAEAARMLVFAADINTTFQGKINDFIKAAGLFIKSGNFDEADASFNKAVACANERQKVEIKSKRKEMYMTWAKFLSGKDNKRKHAMQVYEKLLSIELNPEEKREVQSTLLFLYEKLGKVQDFYSLKRSMNLS